MPRSPDNGGNEVFSHNKKYSLTLLGPTWPPAFEDRPPPEIVVYRHDSGQKEVIWQRRISLTEEQESSYQFSFESRCFLTDDGSKAVICFEVFGAGGVEFMVMDATGETRLDLCDLVAAIPARTPDLPSCFGAFFFHEAAQILTDINGKECYAVRFLPCEWCVLSLETPCFEIASRELAKELDLRILAHSEASNRVCVTSSGGNPPHIVQAAVAETALITSQQSKAKIRLREMRVEEQCGQRDMVFTFLRAGLKGTKLSIEAILEDELGGTFQTMAFEEHPISELRFALAPFRAKLFVLTVYSREKDGGGGYENNPERVHRDRFELSNPLFCSVEKLRPETLPARRELDGVTVELASVEVLSDETGNFIEPAFRFYQDRARSPGWKVRQLSYQDSTGNVAGSVESLPLHETVFRMKAQFMRDVVEGKFNAEEKWEFDLPRIPGECEHVELQGVRELEGITIKVLGLGGAGVYSYRSGKVRSIEELSPRQREPLSVNEPPDATSVEWTFHGAPDFEECPGTEPNTKRIVTRLPHLVYRVEIHDPQMMFAVREEAPIERLVGTISVTGLNHDRSGVYVVPLAHKAGESLRKVTFVVQRPREAEFLFEAPSRGGQGSHVRQG